MLSGIYRSFSAKLKFIASAANIPHPQKAHFGGEDAWFINEKNNTIGVADGVGGWANVPGANAAKYAKDLMKNCSDNSHLNTSLEILRKGYDLMDPKLLGSTTAVIAAIRDSKIDLINLGDSGASLFRGVRTIFETSPQTFSFNFPYQLGTHSETVPENGDRKLLEAHPGDVIILATDGVYDNVWASDIEREVNRAKKLSVPQKIVKEISSVIADMAHKNGLNTRYDSPFAAEARRNGYGGQIGGKLDDVTIVSAMIVNE
ncbi:5-azacytidine resistance protein azr1-related protein [Trichomonas vaginalis G3]|uniref:Protein phosphatase n=1 Tax=Trichomonas vaginalis (strain ATCC PRA-98 / G3) TaxID=412133 RepID=A2E6S6_TRIV3|nr:phosphoprotein phosphatase protein [Trichomonas vaginalis G3]EAY11670.1 5-azacytidine resistance protein azr1-related protein [Trichomonas vaginalis G3]KAI5494925.1 phosphoprotein phosphatase protein [Trichomonas vaginalis G3]|eukprot:XP_001323893.1 5-azacytidine resistance protein azr1-related protein [Trichomonas vaginalis G3]